MSDDRAPAVGPTPLALDYDLADRVHIDVATRMKALGDPLRLLLLDLVLERAMTVSELAARSDRPRGTIAYHVDVLVGAGLMQVVRTRKVRAIDERFYGRVARTIVFPDQPGEIPFLRELVADIDLARTGCDEPEDGRPVSGFTFRHARIPRDRADEYAERLDALALEFIAEARGGDVEYGLYLGIFPTNRLARAGSPGSVAARPQEPAG